ncbi:MAG: DUF1800 domain-containing protein [Gammaproteobacteria bacterium]|nr:DUF1800 domain-containing protein [Gammaproteobacteria bacterium]
MTLGRYQRLIPALVVTSCLLSVLAGTSANETWVGDLNPIAAAEWDRAKARHLLERAGFGGTPEEADLFASYTPEQAVAYLVNFKGAPKSSLPPFEHSGIFEAGLDPFPASRPATTAQAEKTGEALGIKVKASGNRPQQAIVNQFFYWLRASRLETHRVAYWWANRMVSTPRPLQEKMALFWHGHFATNEEKVRDYRKMLRQLELFQREGMGNFRTLMIKVAQDPAMLAFLDAGVNVKGSPNENFAREIMELFTLGVGHYTEEDIREAARAFTGWNFVGVEFHADPSKHDDAEKTVLGNTGRFDGVQVIDLLLAQPAAPEFIAAKLYRFFVRDDISDELKVALGARLRNAKYELAPLLETLFLSKDFYADLSQGTRFKSPVEFVVSTYRKLGLAQVPGAPDFNLVTASLGQHLLYPPTVAGWSYGRSWITPSLLIERGNFALDLVFPDIEFIPEDRYPVYPTGPEIRAVHQRLRAGMDMASATKPLEAETGGDMMAMSNNVDRDEDFNTRYASYRGWQKAIERVKPIPRDLARLDLTKMILTKELTTPLAVVDYFVARFLSVPLNDTTRRQLAETFEHELGSADVLASATVLEDPLRVLLHLILSRPEYQLG